MTNPLNRYTEASLESRERGLAEHHVLSDSFELNYARPGRKLLACIEKTRSLKKRGI